VAGGTGDVAFRILDESGPQTRMTVLDINGEMLKVGAERAGHRYEGRIDFVEANAEELPLESKTYDAYTIAFGIRNVPRIDAALREAHRVLKPGGRFLCLEFSKVDVPVLDKIYDAYSFNVIPKIGGMVTGDAESYQYLVESIRRFPPPAAFARMIEEAGFKRVTHRTLTAGVVATCAPDSFWPGKAHLRSSIRAPCRLLPASACGWRVSSSDRRPATARRGSPRR
jgi:demethylmenaquinone methyltransferase/2-methoxy-6-polyprenyl-1,4-benzoquinol methylase